MKAGPYILAFDTAMRGCSAAVLDAGRNACHAESVAMERGQSEQLVPMIGRVLAKAGIAYKDLSLIVTTVGPGAFTGIRIALSTARALGAALEIPVAGVTTLECIARQAEVHSRLAVILETKRSDFYVQFFNNGAALDEPRALSHAEIAAQIQAGDYMAGDGLERFVSEGSTSSATVIEHCGLVDPSIAAGIGFMQWQSGQTRAPQPLYLRDADVSKPKKAVRQIIDK